MEKYFIIVCKTTSRPCWFFDLDSGGGPEFTTNRKDAYQFPGGVDAVRFIENHLTDSDSYKVQTVVKS